MVGICKETADYCIKTHLCQKQCCEMQNKEVLANFLLCFTFFCRQPFKYGVAMCLGRHLLAKKIKMEAAESTGLTFVDEDEIPIAFLRIAHMDSENEQPSDVDSSEEEESTNESGEENDDSNGEEDQNDSNLRWSSEIRAPRDRNFNKEVGMRVEMEENSNCLQYFELLILNETIRFECQKRHLDHNLRGHLHNFTIPELKAWLGLTLNMGLVRKNSIQSYWSKKSVIQTPIFPNTMSRDRYLHILRFLHFTDNDNAPDLADPNRDKLWKIKPFLNALLFTAVYAPSQNLSLDETLIKFKGRVQCRQFLPLK